MKAYQLINRLKKLNKNARVILDRTSGDLFDIDYENETNEAIILTSEVAGTCKRCGHKIVIERDVKEYPFLCPSCQENMFSSEVKMNKAGKDYYEKWSKHKSNTCNLQDIAHSRFDITIPEGLFEYNKRFFIKKDNSFLEFELKYIYISCSSLINIEIEGDMAEAGTSKIEIAKNGSCSAKLFKTVSDIRRDNKISNSKVNLAVEIAKLGYKVYKSNGDIYVNLYKWNGQKPVKVIYSLKNGFRMTYSYAESFNIKFNLDSNVYKTEEECIKSNELIIKRL
jgi:hypothetical protein